MVAWGGLEKFGCVTIILTRSLHVMFSWFPLIGCQLLVVPSLYSVSIDWSSSIPPLKIISSTHPSTQVSNNDGSIKVRVDLLCKSVNFMIRDGWWLLPPKKVFQRPCSLYKHFSRLWQCRECLRNTLNCTLVGVNLNMPSVVYVGTWFIVMFHTLGI